MLFHWRCLAAREKPPAEGVTSRPAPPSADSRLMPASHRPEPPLRSVRRRQQRPVSAAQQPASDRIGGTRRASQLPDSQQKPQQNPYRSRDWAQILAPQGFSEAIRCLGGSLPNQRDRQIDTPSGSASRTALTPTPAILELRELWQRKIVYLIRSNLHIIQITALTV